VLSLCAAFAPAATIQVGPGRTYTTVQAGYNAAAAGDTIEIDSGTYTGQAGACVKIYTNNLTIRGVGATRPVLDANGQNQGDKGIFVVYANNLTVQNLEMKNTAGPSGNDAGIRYQPATASTPANLTVQNCYIHHNQDGVLTDGDNNGKVIDIVFDSCEFSHNGTGDGQTHNLYIGTVHSFTLRNCYSHDTVEGHEVKTRAKTNYILYNLLSSEQVGTGSRELQLANAGPAYVIGNVIRQGPNSHNWQIITYGDEGANPNLYLYIMNNTIINDRENDSQFITVRSGTTALIQNNIFDMTGNGNETILSGPGTMVTNWETTYAGFANPALHNFRLTAASTGAINMGTAPGYGFNSYPLTPEYQYVYPCAREARPSDATIDIGAYEYTAPNHPPTVNAGTDQTVIEGQPVQLHATASDPDSDPLSYLWTQPAGLNVVLTGATTADASFTTPTVDTIAEAAMTFTVTVNDGKGGQANDSVNVRVRMLGDVNQDDGVDVLDLLIFVDAFGSALGDPDYDPACDFNHDDSVDVVDLLDFVANFGRTLE
jgi:ribosomal protein L24